MNANAQATHPSAVCEKPADLELELENARLQRLVADLIVKNQQLRLELKVAQRVLSH
jgi:hypothetical protein